MIRLVLSAMCASLLLLGACAPKEDKAEATAVGMANPASVNCAQQGGRSEIRTAADGGQYGVCVFNDGRQCEEWALLRDNRCVAPS